MADSLLRPACWLLGHRWRQHTPMPISGTPYASCLRCGKPVARRVSDPEEDLSRFNLDYPWVMCSFPGCETWPDGFYHAGAGITVRCADHGEPHNLTRLGDMAEVSFVTRVDMMDGLTYTGEGYNGRPIAWRGAMG